MCVCWGVNVLWLNLTVIIVEERMNEAKPTNIPCVLFYHLVFVKLRTYDTNCGGGKSLGIVHKPQLTDTFKQSPQPMVFIMGVVRAVREWLACWAWPYSSPCVEKEGHSTAQLLLLLI